MLPVTKLVTILAPIVGGTAVLVWRFQETRTPVTARKLILPPLAMSTGFMMFIAPQMRIPWMWVAGAFLAGALILAEPIRRTSTLERQGDVILMRRSSGFLLILLGLLVLRLLLHEYIGHLVTVRQTASIFFILAFGMIFRWRVGLYRRFRALQR